MQKKAYAHLTGTFRPGLAAVCNRSPVLLLQHIILLDFCFIILYVQCERFVYFLFFLCPFTSKKITFQLLGKKMLLQGFSSTRFRTLV